MHATGVVAFPVLNLKTLIADRTPYKPNFPVFRFGFPTLVGKLIP